jgi:hypothetical protein
MQNLLNILEEDQALTQDKLMLMELAKKTGFNVPSYLPVGNSFSERELDSLDCGYGTRIMAGGQIGEMGGGFIQKLTSIGKHAETPGSIIQANVNPKTVTSVTVCPAAASQGKVYLGDPTNYVKHGVVNHEQVNPHAAKTAMGVARALDLAIAVVVLAKAPNGGYSVVDANTLEIGEVPKELIPYIVKNAMEDRIVGAIAEVIVEDAVEEAVEQIENTGALRGPVSLK